MPFSVKACFPKFLRIQFLDESKFRKKRKARSLLKKPGGWVDKKPQIHSEKRYCDIACKGGQKVNKLIEEAKKHENNKSNSANTSSN